MLVIYENVLGEQFKTLHPALQKRYSIKPGQSFRASGVMDEIKGGPFWLYPLFYFGVSFKLFFPEHGKQVPFTILNKAKTGSNGEMQIHWERAFYFPKKTRYFNALMSESSSQNIIKDYLGEPSVFYSDLSFQIESSNTLTITSKKQRLLLGKLEIPLPRLFQGLATVKETYHEDSDSFTISVSVRNPLIGTVFSYKGAFKEDA
ncbi:DUF4166 domain-containing protein [Guptibacillus algicola]|uniref:DUF4166 domain-containing protein n=1 Tax=Guptibacillus algicola TaxID=225844 RepID=UPI001CD4AF84|nr:DUF4166 domain-containing protein [Alkalihalobacillus algicola]MCA0987389.1 DUF4166 domain-containing protein [Alkalihalobacillus algicola]